MAGFLKTQPFSQRRRSCKTPKKFSKNLEATISALDQILENELYIFNGTPVPANISAHNQTGLAVNLLYSESYTYYQSQREPTVVPGVSVEVIGTLTFPVAKDRVLRPL